MLHLCIARAKIYPTSLKTSITSIRVAHHDVQVRFLGGRPCKSRRVISYTLFLTYVSYTFSYTFYFGRRKRDLTTFASYACILHHDDECYNAKVSSLLARMDLKRRSWKIHMTYGNVSGFLIYVCGRCCEYIMVDGSFIKNSL